MELFIKWAVFIKWCQYFHFCSSSDTPAQPSSDWVSWECRLNETGSSVLLNRKGSFWLQTLDQSGRCFAFLQQEQQKFNLDPFTKKLSALNSYWQCLFTSADISDSQLIVTEGNISERWQCWACMCQTDFLWSRQRSRMESVYTRRGESKRFVVSDSGNFVTRFTRGKRFVFLFKRLLEV